MHRPIQHNRLNRDLQALRGMAILAVVYYHLVDMVPGLAQHMGFWGTFLHGAHGVDLFFVISGYVITRSVYRHIDHTGPVAFSDGLRFWMRRACRTMPPALVWLAICLAVALYTGWNGESGANRHHALAAALQYANFYALSCSATNRCGMFGYYWSLSLEEQFYFLLPVAMLILPRIGLAWVTLLGGLMLTFLYSNAPSLIGLPFDLMPYLPLRIDGLLLGVAIALFQDGPQAQRVLAWLRQDAGIAVFAALLAHTLLWTRGTPLFRAEIGSYLMNGLMASVLVSIALLEEGYAVISPKLLNVLGFFGNISFSLYLSHIIIILTLQNYLGMHWQTAPAAIGYGWYVALLCTLLIMVAWLSHRWLEVPFMRLARRISA